MNENNASRTALIEAGLRIFGTLGYKGASVRRIALAANTPISAITYHFQSKQGLYLACAQHIADIMSEMMSPMLFATQSDMNAAVSVSAARAALKAMLEALIQTIVRQEIDPLAMFLMREQAEPTEAFDIIYGGVMGRVIARIAEQLRALSLGRLTPLESKIRAIALMGQFMAFRVARAAVLRTTGWNQIGPAEVKMIQSVISRQVMAIADQIEREAKI